MIQKVTKDDIIRAFLDDAFIGGAGATSLNDIAGKVGIKKPSLYNHFSSREELVTKTFDSCAAYMEAITFTPKDIDTVAQKYPAQMVLKGIVNRYFKLHEKAPLFQMYTFVESQRHFSKRAADIAKAERQKLITQTALVFTTLEHLGKIRFGQGGVEAASKHFCIGIVQLLSDYLLERKQIIVSSPAAGEGELFSLPSADAGLEDVDAFIDQFVELHSGH